MEPDRSATHDAGDRNRRRPGVVPLTARQREVLALLVARRSDKEIAAILAISRRTASNHVAAVIHRLGAETRAGAV